MDPTNSPQDIRLIIRNTKQSSTKLFADKKGTNNSSSLMGSPNISHEKGSEYVMSAVSQDVHFSEIRPTSIYLNRKRKKTTQKPNYRETNGLDELMMSTHKSTSNYLISTRDSDPGFKPTTSEYIGLKQGQVGCKYRQYLIRYVGNKSWKTCLVDSDVRS